MNPVVLVGLFIGAMPALRVRRPHHELRAAVPPRAWCWRCAVSSGRSPVMMDGKADPDYARCVDLCTKASLHEMVLPTIIAVVVPHRGGPDPGPHGRCGYAGRRYRHRFPDGHLHGQRRRCVG